MYCIKMLQFTSVPNSTCPIQLIIIIGSKNLKPTFVLPPFVDYHSVNTVAEKCFTLPHYLLPLRITWIDKQWHKNTIVILNFVIYNPFLCSKTRVKPMSLHAVCVCPLDCSIDPVDRFSWYNNLIYLTVTPTPHFKFYFPSVSNNKMAYA
jgi:hypothetical protein